MTVNEAFLNCISASLRGGSCDLTLAPDDWRPLLQLAGEQKLLPMVYEAVRGTPAFSAAPEEVRTAARLQTMQEAAAQAVHTEAFLQLYRALLRNLDIIFYVLRRKDRLAAGNRPEKRYRIGRGHRQDVVWEGMSLRGILRFPKDPSLILFIDQICDRNAEILGELCYVLRAGVTFGLKPVGECRVWNAGSFTYVGA